MKLRSKTRFSDTLTVSSGKKTMSLFVDIDLMTLTASLRRAKEALAQARLAALREPCDANVSALGLKLREVIVCIFGEEQAEKCINFYEGDWTSMLDDLVPYILHRIAPRTAKLSTKRRRELERAARRNGRQHT